MKNFFAKKTVAAFLIVLLLFTSSFLNLRTAFPELRQKLAAFWENDTKDQAAFSAFVTSADDTINEKVYAKYPFIEAYGYLQKLLGKKEINNFEVVKDNQGYLHYTYFTNGANPIDEIAQRMVRLNDAASKTGAKVIYLMTPDKFIEGQTTFATGIPYNYANETADHLLAALQENGVDTLDFRELMKTDGIYTPDSFYKTDHHWKVDTAFWAFTKLVDVLQDQYGLHFPEQAKYTNLDNYNQIVYEDSYIGSMAQKEGILYSGAEDFTLIYPKFDTSFNFYAQSGTTELNLQGKFEQALLFNSIVAGNGDIYDAHYDKYFAYMDGNPGFVEITNNAQPAGPTVLFIKDSLIVPTASFFSLGCAKVYMVDPRYYSGSIEALFSLYKFDYVFVSVSPENLTEEFFPFYKTEAK